MMTRGERKKSSSNMSTMLRMVKEIEIRPSRSLIKEPSQKTPRPGGHVNVNTLVTRWSKEAQCNLGF